MTVQHDEQLGAQAIEAGAYEEAVRILRPLADVNSEYALLSLGWLSESGVMGVADKDIARSYYERAAAHGSASAHFYLGRLFLGDEKRIEAREAFVRGAELNCDECIAELDRLADEETEAIAAQAIEAGAYGEAIRLLRPLAESNSENALLTLGWIYETGATGTADINGARSYYEQAVLNGSASACLELGRLLLSEGEDSQARTAFETGAERGDIPCMARLGEMMVKGRGGPADVDAGSTWLEKAASQGHIFAQRTLLGVQQRNAPSILEKILIKLKILSLARRGLREILKDPNSDKMR